MSVHAVSFVRTSLTHVYMQFVLCVDIPDVYEDYVSYG